MRRWWREIFIGFLTLCLITTTASAIVEHSKYVVLQEKSDKAIQSLISQTQLIVELRQKLVPQDFEDLDELTRWVNTWEIENKPVVVSILNHTFVIAGNTELYSQYWDCDDISEAMQRDALRDGYLMSACLVDGDGVVCGRRVSNLGWHNGCITVVDNAFYFIEPQTGEIVFIVRRD